MNQYLRVRLLEFLHYLSVRYQVPRPLLEVREGLIRSPDTEIFDGREVKGKLGRIHYNPPLKMWKVEVRDVPGYNAFITVGHEFLHYKARLGNIEQPKTRAYELELDFRASADYVLWKGFARKLRLKGVS